MAKHADSRQGRHDAKRMVRNKSEADLFGRRIWHSWVGYSHLHRRPFQPKEKDPAPLLTSWWGLQVPLRERLAGASAVGFLFICFDAAFDADRVWRQGASLAWARYRLFGFLRRSFPDRPVVIDADDLEHCAVSGQVLGGLRDGRLYSFALGYDVQDRSAGLVQAIQAVCSVHSTPPTKVAFEGEIFERRLGSTSRKSYVRSVPTSASARDTFRKYEIVYVPG